MLFAAATSLMSRTLTAPSPCALLQGGSLCKVTSDIKLCEVCETDAAVQSDAQHSNTHQSDMQLDELQRKAQELANAFKAERN